MGYFKRGCAVFLASTMVLGLLPGGSVRAAEAPGTAAKEAAAASDFDAYREPFLSGPVQTWVYQGEEFDYENSRNQIFADDQEDGDLTKSIIQKGFVDTSELGDQDVIYEVTDSDGHKSTLTTTVTVLAKDSNDEDAKKIQRKLYTLPDASHLANVGFNRGYNHDRQNLGFWVPANKTLTVKLANPDEFSGELKLQFLNNDKYTEKLVKLDASGQMEMNEEGSPKTYEKVDIPGNGEEITVKNWCKTQDSAGNETNGWQSVNSVPFITTPKNTSVQPIIEIKWNDAFQSIPYYRYGDDEESFFASWDQTKDPYAIIEGDAATFLVPIIDRNSIIDCPKAKGPEYQFHTIDGMLDWYAAFVKQYDAYAGLDFYADQPYNQNVRAKFFIKANKHGAGAAYYGGEESATNGESMDGYLHKAWLSLHEFGHGYEGAIAQQENSFVETTNNIMGYYFEMTYRPDYDLGWLLGGKGSTYLEAYNTVGRQAEQVRKSATVFNDMTEGAKQYDKTLFMFVNLLDRLGPKEATSAMHTDVRKYRYENGEHRRSSDTLVDVFSHEGGYNVIPYFDGWHIHPSDVLEDTIYDSDLPMLYYLRDLIPDDAEAEAARAALKEKGLSMNGIYSLVSTDDLADFSYTSNIILKLSIDDISKIQGKKIQIKNGEKVAAEVTVEAGKTEYSVELPIGIYEVELPAPRTAEYKYNNEYLVAYKTSDDAVVEKELVYTKVVGNPLVDDVQVRLLGMSDCEVFAFTPITGNNGQHQLNCRLNNVEPHIYFPNQTYITVDVQDPNGASVWNQSVNGTGKPDAVNETVDFPNGSKLVVTHEEIGRMRFTSQYTKKMIPEYAASGVKTVTFIMTDKGLKPEGWDQDKLDSAYFSMLKSYSEYLTENMTLDDLEVESRFHNSKMVLSKAYECLSDEEKAEYDKKYGRLIGHEQTVYGYEKIDPSLLTATADSWQKGSEQEIPQNALDESDDNAWHTDYNINCISNNKNTYTITLKEPRNVNRLEYVPKQGTNGRIVTYKLEYSTTEAGDDFQDVIASKLPAWGGDDNKKSVDFEAPQAKRIRITGLTTEGTSAANTNKFMAAKHFWLYERYEVKTPDSYLCDVNLGSAWDENSEAIAMDKTEKTISMAGTQMMADLTGKEFDTLAGKVSLSSSTADFKIYNDDNGKLLYKTEAALGDNEATFAIDIAGIRNLTFKASGTVILSDVKFGNHGHKEHIFLVKGDKTTVSANTSLNSLAEERTKWSTDAEGIASVDAYGNITAVAKGEATIQEGIYNTSPAKCKVWVGESLEEVIQAVKAYKTAKKKELDAYHADKKYDADGKSARLSAINAGCDAIDAAMNISGIEAAFNDARGELDAIATSEEAKSEALKQKKEEAKQELADYKDSADYRKDQRLELKRAIAEGQLSISQQATESDVEEALAAAKQALDEIQTDLQMTKEELRLAISDVESRIKGFAESDFNTAAWQRLQKGISDAKAVAAESSDADIQKVTDAKRELLEALNALFKPQAVKDAEEELKALIDECENLNLRQEDFQTESWASYQEALTDAKTYLPGGENEQSAQETPIRDAMERLRDAVDAMMPVQAVLEGDWEKGLRASESSMEIENGKLNLTGVGGNNDPSTFVCTETFDFSKEGSFEFDLEGYESGRFGIYLDYSEANNFAYGMCFFTEGDWKWQNYTSSSEKYGNSGASVPKSPDQKQRVKVVWTAEGKCSLFIDGKKVIDGENDNKIKDETISRSPQGKIAFRRAAGSNTVSNIRPLKARMRSASPASVEVLTAKNPLQMNLQFRSDKDKQDAKVTWTSSDDTVACVDRTGKILFVSTGTAKITATAAYTDGTKETADMTVGLPAKIEGNKTETDKCPAEGGVITGIWANSQTGNIGNDGPASWAVDGDTKKQWHSQYSNNQPVHPTSDENPVKLTIEFGHEYELSFCQQIQFMQAKDNGRLYKYKLVTGDAFDPESHKILDSALSGVSKVEGSVVDHGTTVTGESWETLQLPTSADADGRLGHYLQIQIMKGHNNYAAIKEITASFLKNIAEDETEKGYMSVHQTYANALNGLEGKIVEAKAADRKDYTEANWNALQAAIKAAEASLDNGEGTDDLNVKKTALETALDAKEEQKQIAVTFVWDTEVGVGYPRYVASGQTVTAPEKSEAPKKQGHYFSGEWYEDQNCTGNKFEFTTTLNTDKTLYAKWLPMADKTELNEKIAEANQAMVGAYTQESKVALKEKLAAAQALADKDDATAAEITSAISALQGAIDGLVKTYVVTFNWNDAGNTVEYQNVADKGQATRLTAAPDWTGHAFAGIWYSNKKCTAEYEFSAQVEGNLTLYATWNEVVDKTALNNCITNAEEKLRENYTEESKAVLQSALTSAQAVANRTEASQSQVDEARKALKKAIDELELKKTIYQVTFNWNYAQAETKTQDVADGDYALALTKADVPERTGYLFTGKWYTEASCAQEFLFEETPITANGIVLYAGWKKEEKCKVTFNWNCDGASEDIRYVNQGECVNSLTIVDAPSRNEFTFTGKWYTDAACTQEYNFATPVMDDIALYAKWDRKPVDPNPELTEARNKLNKSIKQAKAAKQTDYSTTGWETLQAAIRESEQAVSGTDVNSITAAKTKLDAAIAYTKAAETIAEKDKLQQKYDEYKVYNESSYTESTWGPFKEALDAVGAILAKGDAATLEEILAAYQQLADAREDLDLKPDITVDKSKLKTLLTTANEKLSGPYTEDSLNRLRDQIAKAREIMDGNNADQSVVDKAVADLQAAIDALESSTTPPDTHTVTFDWNYAGAGQETQPVADGSQASAPAKEKAPKRDGYIFTGKWYRDSACKQEYDFSESVKGDFTLYAGWQPNGSGSGEGDKDPDKIQEEKDKEAANQAVSNATGKADAVVTVGKGDYTTESWNAFLSAYNAIKNLTEAQKSKMTAVELKRLADNLANAQAALVKETKITSLKFAAKTYQIANGKSVNLQKELTILPEEAANQKLVWTMSGSSKYAKLNSATGVVKALKKGIKKSVTITVATEDGKVSAKATIKVMKGRVSKISAKGAKKVKVKAGKSVTLKANVKATGGTPVNKALKWTSLNPEVATVKGSGKLAASAKVKVVKGAKKGKKATITAVSTDGTNKKLKFTVTVK